MMHCEQVQQLLYGTLAEDLGQLPAPAQAHLQQCATCRACRDDVAAMSGALAETAPPALPDGFELSLRRRLAQAARELPRDEQPRARGAAWRWMVAVAATVVVVVSGALLWRMVTPPAADASPRLYRLALAVQARAAHDGVLFEVALPERVELAADVAGLCDGQCRQLRWRSALQPGVNEIDLPLASRTDEPASITVSIRVAGRSVTRRVSLATAHSERRTDPPRLALLIDLGPRGRSLQ